ncbi:MAG: hypothetical protein WCK35_06370 [Chloroflexota bacterium]
MEKKSDLLKLVIPIVVVFGLFLAAGLTAAFLYFLHPFDLKNTQSSMSQSGAEGRQIVFKVEGGIKFSNLKIEGINQNGVWSKWKTTGDYEKTIDLTDKWYWKETVILTFDVRGNGHHTCVIDYLEQPSYDPVAVTYSINRGCSGDAGSASNVEKLDALVNYMEGDDSYQVLKEANKVKNSAKCASGIIQGVSSGNYFIVVNDCKGIALSTVNSILKKYKKELQTP